MSPENAYKPASATIKYRKIYGGENVAKTFLFDADLNAILASIPDKTRITRYNAGFARQDDAPFIRKSEDAFIKPNGTPYSNSAILTDISNKRILIGDLIRRIWKGAGRDPERAWPDYVGRTGRELLCMTAGFGLAAIISAILFGILGFRSRALIFVPLLFAAPFLAFGFIVPGGLKLEDFFIIWWSNNIKSAPVRKLSSVNAYEKMQILALKKRDEKQNGKEQKKGKKTKKEKKQKKLKSAYTVRF